MDRFVVFGKSLLEEITPKPVDLCETLADEAEELCVSFLLGATFDNHRRELGLLSSGEVDLHELVHGFLRVGTGHDRKVDGSAEIDEIGVGLILDFDSLCLLFLLIGTVVIVIIVVVLVVVAALSKNLRFELLVRLLVLLPLWVELEDVQPILDIELAHQLHPVCDLVFFLHKVQLFLDGWVVFELVLPDLE
jgi:hypothetical protein